MIKVNELRDLSEKNEELRKELVKIIKDEIDAINGANLNIHSSISRTMFSDCFDDVTVLRFVDEALFMCCEEGNAYEEINIDDGGLYATSQLIIIYQTIQEIKDCIKSRFKEENDELEELISNYKKRV